MVGFYYFPYEGIYTQTCTDTHTQTYTHIGYKINIKKKCNYCFKNCKFVSVNLKFYLGYRGTLYPVPRAVLLE